MPLSPQTAKKLMSDVSEMREFISYLSEEALKLNNLDDIQLEDPIELSVEVKARKKAFEKIINILSPLLNTQEVFHSNLKEYVV